MSTHRHRSGAGRSNIGFRRVCGRLNDDDRRLLYDNRRRSWSVALVLAGVKTLFEFVLRLAKILSELRQLRAAKHQEDEYHDNDELRPFKETEHRIYGITTADEPVLQPAANSG